MPTTATASLCLSKPNCVCLSRLAALINLQGPTFGGFLENEMRMVSSLKITGEDTVAGGVLNKRFKTVLLTTEISTNPESFRTV